MKRNVLFVTYYWPPSGGAGVQRCLKFIKYLPEFDICPLVLTVENPTYPIVDKSLEEDIPEGVRVSRTRTLEPFSLYARLTGKPVEEAIKPTLEIGSGGMLSRLGAWIRGNLFLPDARAGWLLTARGKATDLVEEHGIDTVITTGPPHSVHFVGHHAKKKKGVRWIADFRDPWSGIYYNQLMNRTGWASKLDLAMERKILGSADHIVVVSKSMRTLQQKILDRSYEVIPNGFDPDDFGPTPAGPSAEKSAAGPPTTEYSAAEFPSRSSPAAGSSDRLTIRHVGSVSEAAVPAGFLTALTGLEKRTRFRVEFIGNIHPKLQKLIDEKGLSDLVSVIPYLPHDKAIGAMQTADLLLLSIPQTEGNELILTGKLFEYLGSGTPILMLGPTPGDAAAIIDEMDQGTCFEHSQVEAIRSFLDGFGESRSAGPSDQRRGTEDRPGNDHPYSRRRLTGALADLINRPQ